MSSLAADLRKLAASLAPSDLFTSAETDGIVAAIVRVLEHEGITVAEELLPKPVDAIVAPVVKAAAPSVESELHKLLSDFAERLDKLEGSASPSEDAAQDDATPPASGQSPAAPVAPPTSATAPVAPPPSSTSTSGSSGPVAPPIAGAE